MSFPKILALIAIVLFGAIGVAALFKNDSASQPLYETEIALEPFEIALDNDSNFAEGEDEREVHKSQRVDETIAEPLEAMAATGENLPEADRIEEFFNKRQPQLPIIETITYKSRVPWLKGRPAWISDYASHYKTSRHFIARSLNGRPDYEKQDVSNGMRFNVLKEGKELEFYLVIDVAASKMWFYYLDKETNERVLVKTYKVGLGRPDPASPSGILTPLGKFKLGEKIAVYRPKSMGFHQGSKVEMVKVFGTRWIPFEEEIGECTDCAQGYGIHGLPLVAGPNGELKEDLDSLGRYESDGCIRMATADIEELFAIIITRPTTVELVKGFHNAKPPGEEKQLRS